jgi:hypothetical protein
MSCCPHADKKVRERSFDDQTTEYFFLFSCNFDKKEAVVEFGDE